MTERRDNPDTDRVTEEAAAWLLRLQSPQCTEQECEQFKAWIQASPAHAQEYDALREVWTLSGELTPTAEPNSEEGDTSPVVGGRTAT